MSNLDIVVPEEFVGVQTVKIAKGPDGSRDFVQGQGADFVPSKTGPGDVHFVDENFEGEALTFDNVNDAGRMAIVNAAQAVVNNGARLTHRAVLEALRSRASSVSSKDSSDSATL